MIGSCFVLAAFLPPALAGSLGFFSGMLAVWCCRVETRGKNCKVSWLQVLANGDNVQAVIPVSGPGDCYIA